MAAHGLTGTATLCHMTEWPEIDRQSATPPYRQVAAHLISLIRAGRYAPGDRLPAIPDIVHTYGVARRTAAKALHAVGEAGYASLSPGMGWYVPERGTAGAHDDDRTR